ncbi:MAG: M15 family metallopeptidase [Bdellovibrionales bacterium]
MHVSLAYATNNNFFGQKVYSINRAFLLEPVAEKLSAANSEFRSHGFCIKVLDAYRPFSVQEKFWEKFPKPTYLAQPLRNGDNLISGSKHSRGAAVDITLVDDRGIELLMPTQFDEFSHRAARQYSSVNEPARSNVILLEEIMHKHQFVGLPSEWWHFDYKNWDQYPLVEISL